MIPSLLLALVALALLAWDLVARHLTARRQWQARADAETFAGVGR